MKILIINGAPSSGKSLFCNYALMYRELVYSYSTIDEVKELARLLGWDGVKDKKGRKFLSDLKDALTEYNDLPRKHLEKQICEKLMECKSLENNALFLIQMREPKEIQKWVDLYGAKTLLIKRPDTLKKEWDNHADDEVLNYKYDYELLNTKTKEDWKEEAIEFIDMVRKEEWESTI